MNFIHNIPMAFLGLVLTGFSWCLIGVAMSDASRRKCDVRLIMFFSYLLTGILSLLLMGLHDTWPTASIKLIFWITLNDIVANTLNFSMQYTLSLAMRTGPNGIIWGIVQSATLFPFLSGLFLGDTLTWQRGGGIAFLLLALVLFSITKDNSHPTGNCQEKSGKLSWKSWAFISFAFTGAQQTFSTLPSYFSDAVDNIPIVYRMAVAGFVGAICGAMLLLKVPSRPEDGTAKQNFRKFSFWQLVLAVLIPLFFAELFCMYPALNVLAPAGMGGLGYPLMVGSCIIGFTILSWTYYKEKFSMLQLLAVLVCLLGLIGLCK